LVGHTKQTQLKGRDKVKRLKRVLNPNENLRIRVSVFKYLLILHVPV